MGKLSKLPRRLGELIVVGNGIRGTCEAILNIWKKGWKQVDRMIGLVGREIYKRSVEINPNKVFFYTQEFRYGCNPKYICEELKSRNNNIDIVWRLPDKGRGGIPTDVRGVRPGTLSYYQELFSSKIIVANSYVFLDQTTFLKKGQILIQTWHGSLGIKRFGKHDMKGYSRITWASIVTGNMTDYCITNSSFVSSSLRNTYWGKTPMLEYGHPRNDLFFEPYREKREALRKKLCEEWGVAPDSHFLMYGPTFRDSKTFDCYNIDFERLSAALKNRFGGEWVVLLRYHPSLVRVYQHRGLNIENELDDEGSTATIINVTGYLDMQELIAVTDVAITDYSSWIYDFMLQRRPGFIFATDIALYNNERGFCYPLETTPFPIATDNDQLVENILSFDTENYLEKLEYFLKEKGCIEDGHASERVADLIEELIHGKKQKERNQ